jgi:hypothetical protein
MIEPILVSEPISLRIHQKTGDTYLYAQIFAGCMYLAAALCMWFLRGWKIAELIDQSKEKRLATNIVIDSIEQNSGYEGPTVLEKLPSSGAGLGNISMWRHV